MLKKTADEIVDKLAEYFPDAKPELEFSSEYELLVAVILSAQCTDKRVNIVTRELFKNYNTPEKMLELNEERLSEIIRPCGLNLSKAKHILSASKSIVENFGGKVPSTLKGLTTLDGVGRKTANVVYSVVFGGNAIAVDTHVFRVSNRIGLARAKTVSSCEEQLMKIIDENKWSKTHHYLIFLGRRICKAQKPNCSCCPIEEKCEKRGICS